MRYLFLVPFLLLTQSLLAQLTTSFEIGGHLFADRDKIMFVDKSLSPGGEIGVNFSYPVFNNLVYLESGLLFYDSYYHLSGKSDSVVWIINDDFGSYPSIYVRCNNFGLMLPVTLRLNINAFQLFTGISIQNDITSNHHVYEVLYGSTSGRKGTPSYVYGTGLDIITLSSFNWHLILGANIVLSPKFKVRAQYSRGMNDYATHEISPRIVNGENMGTVTQSTHTDRYKLSLVYTPQWGVKKDKTAKKAKRKQGLKNFFKDIYQ
jgi:hypothetical protein